jgi:hypothetical protein
VSVVADLCSESNTTGGSPKNLEGNSRLSDPSLTLRYTVMGCAALVRALSGFFLPGASRIMKGHHKPNSLSICTMFSFA